MNLRDYELMYIVRPTVGDDQVTAAQGRIDGMIQNLGGEVTDNQPWGKRRLAYQIQNHDDGYYIVARIKLDPAQTHELEEQLRISDEIIRHMLVLPVAKSFTAPIFVPAPQGQAQAPAMFGTQQPTTDDVPEADMDADVADDTAGEVDAAGDVETMDETADDVVETQTEDAEPAQ